MAVVPRCSFLFNNIDFVSSYCSPATPPTLLCVSLPLGRPSFVSQCSTSVPVLRSLYECPPSVTSIDFAGNAEESNGFVLLSASILVLPVCLDADESTHTEETECDHCYSNCWTDEATCRNLWLKVTCSHLIKSYCFEWFLIFRWCAVKSCTSKKKSSAVYLAIFVGHCEVGLLCQVQGLLRTNVA